ncbi:hypothetical protein K2173_027764 [Erythroxylum novogranatense]|uniref:DYW domain-containing protein n=1 Tax=Erythroxylum novogranatense TaxID=1862640 RepID=A0AAV8TZY7_9ROSI|nr:hypothetical protein K2173_027764 [Erythroxylum novogranatense]
MLASSNYCLLHKLAFALPSSSSLQFHTFSTIDSLVSTLICSLSSCNSVSYCRALHCQIIKSVSYKHDFIGDQLVSGYVRLGCQNDAQYLFDELPDKDIVSWNSLFSVFSRKRDFVSCLNAFSRMRFEFGMKPNEVTVLPVISACTDEGALNVGKCVHGFALKSSLVLEVKVANALINFYGKSGLFDAAYQLFEEMPVQSSVSWNSIIAVCVRMGLAERGFGIYVMMRRAGIVSDQATLVTLLQACEVVGSRKMTEAVHGYVISSGLNLNLTIGTSVLNLYAKSGLLNASRKIFEEMTNPDAIAWTVMLGGFALHGCGREAIKHFELMVGVGMVPDHVTFTHLLSACSHSGLVKEGQFYFRIMSQFHGIEPIMDHYACMVDLLGRAGLLSDAYNLIKSMPMEPNSAVWGALLGACRVYGNIELGIEVAEKMFVLEPSDSRNYIILSNMYSAAGQWKDASKMRALMKERNLTRNKGCSFIEHENQIHKFVAGDQSHPMTDQIYRKLEELVMKVQEAGHASKTEFVLHNVDEEVKEDLINKHSEKLAIAFGVLVAHPDMPLIITKNLRICDDCHAVAKLISLIEKRAIIIRDTRRFHHFTSGLCSCGDYW